MRYINLRRLRLPDGWLTRAAAAKSAVSGGDDPKEHSGIWRELKDRLADLSNDKCWYCEVPVPRSDNAVDHFRPKGRVSDAAQEHAGYRWLAFQEINFRYACTFCNSKRKDVQGGTEGGKSDRFPLIDEAKRVYVEGPTNGEDPLLLDPCEVGDWRLIGCKKENGKACSAFNEPAKRLRADASIEIYHLNHDPTCKLRHFEAVNLLSNIDEAKDLFLEAQADTGKEAAFKKVAAKILGAIHSDNPFSGEMRFLLGGERDLEHPWIQELLET